jgi:hypothetical protein
MDRSPGFGSATWYYFRPLQTRFPYGSGPSVLNLAPYHNSPVRSTKSTRSRLNALPPIVNIGFQVLFHSPPGVLFTFPSRYYFAIGHQGVFSLGGWSPLLPTRFHVPRGTLDPGQFSIAFAYRTFTFFGPSFQMVQLAISNLTPVRNPGLLPGRFGLFPVRSPLLRKSRFLSFPPGT